MKEEKIMDKIYKVLLEEDGELKSTIAGRGLGKVYLAQDKPRLTYKEGQITYAPEGTVGLFSYRILGEAKRYSKYIPHDEGTIRIHEAIPLGNRFSTFFFNSRVYPALLLGKEVWREEAPKEGWVDVTSECTLGITEVGRVTVSHGGEVRVILGSKGAVISVAIGGNKSFEDVKDYGTYRVELLDYAEGWANTGGIKVFHKQAI